MLDMDKIFLISDIPGYTPQISRLMSMMNYARYTTFQSVQGLTTEQLDFTIDSTSNSIGSLLLHFAAVEYAYQLYTFEHRDLNEDEMKKWGAALDLGELGREQIKGNKLEYYIHILNEIRDKTYDLFKLKTDEWLYEEHEFWNQKTSNYYFMWFHVLEDEINHRGQIRWLRKRLPIDIRSGKD
ncbi:DinB family protein [Paenibacillus aestuarii]|uniref:DinB family protein n=1 Tax=Paenibacillus aestuarii TaxID=516965 RepID=A0ABW0KE59_9BACL|nr:DinB family protein [Paenibacillus aestuarii]